MMFQRLIGVAVIVVAFFILYLVSSLQPPVFVQIGAAFTGSFICLVGVVVLFSESQIKIRNILRKNSPKEVL